MRSPAFGKIPFGVLISNTSHGGFVFLNDRLRPPGLSAGRFPVMMLHYKKQNTMQEILIRHYHLTLQTLMSTVGENRCRSMQNIGGSHVTG